MCGESRTHGVNRGKSWKHWKRQAYLSELAESAKAENRPNDVRYQYIIIGNDLLFVIKSQYQKVRRRIEYRLLRNLKRNFGLRFNLIDGVFSNSKYGIYEGIDPNRSFMEWDFFYSRDKNWSMFEKAYEKAYGELPVTGFLKMQKKYERGDVQ